MTKFLTLTLFLLTLSPAFAWDPYGRDTVHEGRSAPSIFGEFMAPPAPKERPQPTFDEVRDAPKIGEGSVANGDAFFVLERVERDSFEEAGKALGEAYSTKGGEGHHDSGNVYE